MIGFAPGNRNNERSESGVVPAVQPGEGEYIMFDLSTFTAIHTGLSLIALVAGIILAAVRDRAGDCADRVRRAHHRGSEGSPQKYLARAGVIFEHLCE